MQSILKRLFREESLPNISVLGLDDAGKTTILYKLASTPVITTIPTIGINVETANIKVQAPIKSAKKFGFTAWVTDVGGCSRLHPLVQRWMIRDSTSGVVWVIDANDRDRLVESREELRRLLLPLGDTGNDYARSTPIMILLTKEDKPSKQSAESIHSNFDDLLEGRPVAWFETCPTAPLSSSGLLEAFAWLGDAIASSTAGADTANSAKSTLPEAEKSVDKKLADMRSPFALSAKLEEWLSRAEKDCTAEDLLQQFYALDLPSWDHYTHLRLAYILLLKHGRREGKDKIFGGFKNYIDNSGKVHGKSFHTTMTYFWVQMVHLGIACMDVHTRPGNAHSLKTDVGDQVPRLDDFLAFLTVNQYLVDWQLWADYYSKEVLMSKEAKEGVVFPDVKGLPDVVTSVPANFLKKAVPVDVVSVSSKTALV